MRINAVLHKVGKDNFRNLKDNIAKALENNPDIIFGPDASLREDENSELSSRDYRNRIYGELQMLSKDSKTIIIPGTITYPINEKEIVCEAPLFCDWKLLKVFHKERDNGESILADAKGLKYLRGCNALNRFSYHWINIAVEICGDHGNQDVRGCDLELILAYDSKAGFWLNASNDDFARKAVVCDGYKPKIEAFDYNPAERQRIKIIEPVQISKKVFTFEI